MPLLFDCPPDDDDDDEDDDIGVINQSSGKDKLTTSPFVDIVTLGLRRSSRPKNHPIRMSQVDLTTKEIRHPASRIGLLILTASAFISPAESL